MKKLLSIVLTLALLISCIAVSPLIQTTAESSLPNLNNNDWAIKDSYKEIFDTVENYQAPGHVNPNIDPADNGGLWLGASNLSGDVNNRAHVYLGNWKTTGEILERNKISPSNVRDFEWKFDYKGTDIEGNGNIRSAFLFHTNDNSKITESSEGKQDAYWRRDYAFSFMVWGSNWSYEGTDANPTKTNDAVPNSISLQVPVYSSTDESMMGKPRPLNYTVSDNIRVPSEDSYLALGKINLSKWATITVKMVGTKITLTVEQDDIKLTKDFTVAQNQLSLAPAGDFAIIQGGNQSAYKNMIVNRPSLIFDSSADTLVQNPGNAEQVVNKEKNTTVGEITTSNGVYTMPVYSSTDELIESSLGEEVNLTDFVWETEFSVNGTNANYAGMAFNFHVDKDRTKYLSKLPGDTGVGIGYKNRQNMMSASVYGDAMGTATDDANTAGTSAVVLQSSNTSSSAVIGCSTAVGKTDNDKDNVRATSYMPLSRSLTVNTYYTIRIVLSGKNLYTYIWETDNKSATLRSVYQTLTDEQYASAPSGDFAVVIDNRAINVKSMKIWDTVDVLRSEEDYSEYTDILAPTVYDFEDNDFGGITQGAGQTSNLSISDDGRLQLGDNDDGNIRVTALNFDGGNETMRDFVVTFDYSIADPASTNDNWLVDRLIFRDIGGTSQYQLEIDRQGIDTNNQNYCTISIIKTVGEDSETVGSASLSRSLNYDTNYKIKLEVIGNVFKVYVAVDDVFTTPALICTDDSFTQGFMYWYHNSGLTYIDNFKLYDITATELASQINTVTSDIKRGMDGQIDSLYTVYNAMHSAQQAKLAVHKTALDKADAELDELEMLGHDINGTGNVDICDLVAMNESLDGNDVNFKNDTADPLLDGSLDSNDISELRNWLLGLKKKITNILCIGNSYTQDTMTYVAQLADSMGIEDLHFAHLYSPGRDIPKHYASALGVFGENYPELLKKYENNSYYQNGDYLYWYETYTKDGRTYKEHTTIKEALLDNEWDIVFFQTSPTGAAFTSGFEKLDKLMDYIRKYEGDDVKFMWHNSWAYANLDYDETIFNYDDNIETTQCTYAAFADENGAYSQDAMHNLIVNKFASLFGEGGIYADSITIDDVIPSGIAIQNARESGIDFKIGDENYWNLTRDGYHLSKNMGRYIGSLTLIRQFTGEELVYSDNLFRSLEDGEPTEDQVKAAIDAVNAAFAQRDALKTK